MAGTAPFPVAKEAQEGESELVAGLRQRNWSTAETAEREGRDGFYRE